MRSHFVPLVTLLAVGVSAPAWAQQAVTPVAPLTIVIAPVAPATPDMVVARLMSFDRNADGKIVVGELPERMQSLLARGDSSKDGALDLAEVRGLAASPTSQGLILNGLQGGRYGFRDSFDSDTSQRIDDALDDLRLAGNTKERALEIARKFMADADARAPVDLMATMGHVLSREQMEDLRTAIEGQTVTVPAVRRDGVTFFGALPEETAGQERVMVRLRVGASLDLERYIQKYALSGDLAQQALVAIRQFKAHTPGRLNPTERSALLEQFRGLLTDEQRDDLRAALDRRPLVKLADRSIPAPSPLTPPVFLQTVEPDFTFTVRRTF